jgi:hypothetical protein
MCKEIFRGVLKTVVFNTGIGGGKTAVLLNTLVRRTAQKVFSI